jgi:hypothetical protein
MLGLWSLLCPLEARLDWMTRFLYLFLLCFCRWLLIACSDKVSLCFSGLPDRQTFVAFTYAAMGCTASASRPLPLQCSRPSSACTDFIVYGWLSRRGLHCFQLPVSMPWLLLSDLLSLKKQASSRSQISLRLFLPRH